MASSASLLDAPLLLLYGWPYGQKRAELHRRAGGWRSMTAATLQRLGYANPRGDAYLVTEIEPIPEPSWLELVEPEHLRPDGTLRGQPFSISWLDLVLSVQHLD